MRIVYMGTPAFAAHILSQLANYEHGEVVGVYTQPDRAAGRGKALQEPETKILAKNLGIPVYQPLHFRNNPEAITELRALKPDVLVVAAYGMLLPQEVLDIPTFGAFNVHASLLPKYRGAAPVQRALINGDVLTGVTIMRMEAGLDTGPIVLQQSVNIFDFENQCDNTGTLLDTLSEHGAKLMLVALNMIKENRLTVIPQDNERATHAAKLTKQEAQVDFLKSAEEIHNHIRGFSPNPGATAQLAIEDKDPINVRLEKGYVLERLGFSAQDFYEQINCSSHANTIIPGTILGVYKQYIVVKTGEGHYGISQIRLAGKSPMDATAFNNGYLKSRGAMTFLLKQANEA